MIHKKMATNIFFSLMEKIVITISQFLSSVLLVRLLGNHGVALLAMAGGVFSFVTILNLSWESILIRSNVVESSNLQDYFNKFFFFNLIKSAVIVLFSLAVGLGISHYYHHEGLLWAILSYAMICILDIMISPFLILCSTKYKQKIVTGMVVKRWLLHLILICGYLKWPTLEYAFLKELILVIVMIASWCYVGRKYLNTTIKMKMLTRQDWAILKKDFGEFTLWTHLTAVSAQILYRVDALILSFFAPLSVVGQYGIALNAANAAYIIPSVLSYQNTVINSQVSSDIGARKITGIFFRLSGIIGILTFVGYLFLGHWYLGLMTKESAQKETYQYLLIIVVGVLIVKTLVSTLVSYINSRGDVKRLFLFVSLPTLCCGIGIYTIGCYVGLGIGLSLSNIAVAILWLFLSLQEMKRYGFSYKSLFFWNSDYQTFQYEDLYRTKKAS